MLAWQIFVRARRRIIALRGLIQRVWNGHRHHDAEIDCCTGLSGAVSIDAKCLMVLQLQEPSDEDRQQFRRISGRNTSSIF
jgi:hypothetical protein